MTLIEATSKDAPAVAGVHPACVALYCPGWPLSYKPNGIVSYTETIRDGMQELGVEVHVLSSQVDPTDLTAGIVDLSTESRSLAERLHLKYLRRFHPAQASSHGMSQSIRRAVERLRRQHEIELLEMEESFGWVGQVARTVEIPVVARLHCPWFLSGRAAGVDEDDAFHARNRAEIDGIMAAAGVTAPSRNVLEYTRDYFKVELPDARVIANPIAPAKSSDHWRANEVDPHRILFVGRFDRIKGADLIIDAMRMIRHAVPDAQLAFVGPDKGVRDGSGRVWSVEEYLKDRFSDATERIAAVEHLGWLPHDQVMDLRRTAAVTVVCSRYENFPMTVLEAMSLGCPIVGTRVGGIAELLEHERNGLLCEPEDAASIAHAVVCLLKNRELAAALGAEALRASARYHPQAVARETVEYYAEVMERWSEEATSK